MPVVPQSNIIPSPEDTNRRYLGQRRSAQTPRYRNNRFASDVRDLDVSPVASAIITAAMLIFCTWAINLLTTIVHDNRPFTLFYFVPVAFGAAFLGIRGGIATSVLAVILARVYLFDAGPMFWKMPTLSDDIELLALAFGTFTVAIVTGRLRTVLGQLNQANIDLRDSERRRTGFNREVLLAVTGGRLQLCDDQELSEMLHGNPSFTMQLSEPIDASRLRHAIKDGVHSREIPKLRLDDICTAATEAATNAVKHGNGGTAHVWLEDNSVSVLIEDDGSGISPAQLARATLERGFSTRVSLGMGYYMMLEAVDSLALSTSPRGTSILLKVGTEERMSTEQNLLAHYSSF
jgi:anti-sigma regulatory factor (Ser/Thr protein kinase)